MVPGVKGPEIKVGLDLTGAIAATEALSRALAGMCAIASELAENLRKIEVDNSARDE